MISNESIQFRLESFFLREPILYICFFLCKLVDSMRYIDQIHTYSLIHKWRHQCFLPREMVRTCADEKNYSANDKSGVDKCR